MLISKVPKLSQGDENDSKWVIVTPIQVKVRLAQTEAQLTGDTVVVSLSRPMSEERERGRQADYDQKTIKEILLKALVGVCCVVVFGGV